MVQGYHDNMPALLGCEAAYGAHNRLCLSVSEIYEQREAGNACETRSFRQSECIPLGGHVRVHVHVPAPSPVPAASQSRGRAACRGTPLC